MKVIIGLGNPGKEYHNTRHNVGFVVLDALAHKFQNPNDKFQTSSKFQAQIYKTEKLVLVKPQLFMNRSGEAVQKVINYFLEKHEARSPFGKLRVSTKHENLYVVHDDLDIKLGEYKIQFGKGPKVHNGVSSVEQALGTKDFWRVRVGIENRLPGTGYRVQGEEYVLNPFDIEERPVIQEVVEIVSEELYGRLI